MIRTGTGFQDGKGHLSFLYSIDMVFIAVEGIKHGIG